MAARILIVEDELLIALETEERLRELGYQITGIACCAEDALRAAELYQPDLILMDVKLTGSVDGIDVASQVKSLYDIPVIFLTGYTNGQMLSRAKQAEPYGYLVKPLRSNDLYSTVELALHKHALDQELRLAKKGLEKIVEERTSALEEEKRNLAETNAALKILLRQREEDKDELQESILSNMRNLIKPYLEKMKSTPLTEEQKTYLEILELHLYEITSPFANRLSQSHLKLTPVEVQVAQMIRNGKNTSEIARSLSLADSTIRTHRENLRKKLDIVGKKINLRSYLQSLQ